jgi:23S rRNA (uracil1939-C5)-methyltransferase
MTVLKSSDQWQQGNLVEVEIEDLGDRAFGIGRYEGRVVFVPDTVPGDRALVRLVRVKPNYAHGKLQELLGASEQRIRPHCIVADKCGGCQWQHIDYGYQQAAKEKQVREALTRIGGFENPTVAPLLTGKALHYRNKVTYPLGRSSTGNVQAGYYRQGTHQLINLNACPVQDTRLDPFLAEIKQDIQAKGWSIYDETKHQGKLRHLGLRIGQQTGEVLLTLISTSEKLEGLTEQAETWLEKYPQLVGVCVNINRDRGNIIFGDQTYCVAGQPYLTEIFAGLSYQLRPETFFQVNTMAAQKLLEVIGQHLNLEGNETLVDAYCGIGTFTLPLAQTVKQAIGIEVQETSITQAQTNAAINGIENVTFYPGTVETVLPQLQLPPNIVILDPPRKGCDRAVLDTLLLQQPQQIVYVSCKPATLARDLKYLCESGTYQLNLVQPADFFPQTAHVECAAFLSRNPAISD